MKRQIIFTNYNGYQTDLRKTLAIRFGLNVKQDQIKKYLNGDIILSADMTDEQFKKIEAWKNAMSEV